MNAFEFVNNLDRKFLATRVGYPSIIVTERDVRRGNVYLTELFKLAKEKQDAENQAEIEAARAGRV